jgi:uncharacterized protein DUF2188
MPFRRTLEVRFIEDRWGVVYSDTPTPISLHPLKREAIQVARAIAIREDADLKIFDAGAERVSSPDDTI